MLEKARVPLESSLTPEQVSKFEQFVQKVTEQDGTSPFSEQTVVAIRQASKNQDRSARLFYFLNDSLDIMGAWALVESQDDAPGVIEGAVLPSNRGGGVASHTIGFMKSSFGVDFSRYNLWVHQVRTDSSAEISAKVAHFVRKLGYKPVRELHKMQVDLTHHIRDDIRADAKRASLPEGLKLRTYSPSEDDLAWLTLNAAAFAHHPEQGKLSQSDLDERKESPWFDPAGFFIVQAPNGLAGYHWTKIDPAQPEDGEVYAVGISPAWQGKGLGKVLTLAGMTHLAETPKIKTISLYVDAENTKAFQLYRFLGFSTKTIDTMYASKR